MEQPFVKIKIAKNQVRNIVDINTLLQALNVQNHFQMLSQQARNHRKLQEQCQSEDQANVGNEGNDFIAESDPMLRSYCHRMDINNQTFSQKLDSGAPPNKECPVSQES